MRWENFLPLILTYNAAAWARGVQIPLGVTFEETPAIKIFQDGGTDGSSEQWRLDEPPSANATGHLIFETVSSLLQHWPNTRYRNGHTIVPATVPPGTLLYHGTFQSVVPAVPEWVATDAEHSLGFCRGTIEAGCWHLTLATTRPLQLLYFDGSSGADFEGGTMDAQDFVAWGELRPDRTFDEHGRIADLCAWGKQYSLDGFVRMEENFEIMLCNFTSDGVRVVSFLNLPALPALESDQPPISGRAAFRTFEMMNGGHWHNRYPGDERIHLDLTRLISFYDTELVPSLVAHRVGQERWDHRLQGADAIDIAAVRMRLSKALSEHHDGSGVDWRTLYRVIIKRYADRLELLQYLLGETNSNFGRHQDEKERASKIQLQLRIMLTPYILHSSIPTHSLSSPATGLTWAEPVFRECATTHTATIVSEFGSALTSSERLMLRAAQETSREICRVVVQM
ncbi:hypothetical protein BV22DRAFT_1130017 [Leucogyrophana mollusca]|uniref:Uncharacterized protein n=1 Tax=Leucogyrophana mollusca TaxID=85980 RepID=A0ACB8BI17_9AGAM|nr:hypothetical protein BV22DRAFT_1130017 [Leucogyrophana mollusca]